MFSFGVLVLIGIVLLIVWALRNSGGAGAGEQGRYGAHDPALEEARKRYARGEISRDELEQIERDLRR